MTKLLNSDQDKEKITKLYLSGLSCLSISKRFECGEETIRQRLKKNGCRLRSPYTRINDYKIKEDYFNVIDNENKAYLLGYLFADGSVSKDGYYLSLGLSTKDEYIIDSLLSQIYIDKKPKKNYRKKVHMVKGCISSKKICDSLLRIGFREKQNIPHIPDHLFNHFARGMFDGDGCITFSGKRPFVSFVGEHNFLREFQNQLVKAVKIKKTQISEIKGIHRFIISSIKDCYLVLDFIYDNATIFLQRKRNKFDLLIKNHNINHYLQKHKYSQYEGVTFDKSRDKWMARYGKKFLGRFKTEKEAHKVVLDFFP